MVGYQMKKQFRKGFLFNGRGRAFNAFKGNIFPVKVMSDNGCEKTSSTLSNKLIKKPNHDTGLKC